MWRQRLCRGRPRRAVALNRRSSGSLLAGISNRQSREITASWLASAAGSAVKVLKLLLYFSKFWTYWGWLEAKSFFFSFFECLAANWAFVHFGRQLIHNKVIVVNTVRSKTRLLFRASSHRLEIAVQKKGVKWFHLHAIILFYLLWIQK